MTGGVYLTIRGWIITKKKSQSVCLMTSYVVDRALQILISLTLFNKDIYRNYLIIS